MSSNKYINEDTYQTLQEVNIETQSDYEKAIEPLWKENPDQYKDFEIFVATPVHSEVSIHYTQALIEFQQDICRAPAGALQISQGRNLSVAGFLESKATHLLFIDSDIYFQGKSIFAMLKADKHIISVPYPLKTLMWEKAFNKMQEGAIKSPDDIRRALHTYPMKVPDPNNIKLEKGVMEVTDSPTGCMLIKREVIDKMIEKYPDKEIVQMTVINGKYVNKPNMWNFFDTLHDPKEKTYNGEDFAFCKLWRDLGGKCYAYVNDAIVHIGEHQYQGKFYDELISTK